MFWNNEFLDSSPSHIDVLLQMQTIKLSDLLFEEDLLQELKTSNTNLIIFLTKPDVIAELVENIVRLTEKDCCDKLLYSRVHAAYISCEILTAGSSEIFAALMSHPESLNKIINCLIDSSEETSQTRIVPQKATLVNKLISSIHSSDATNLSCYITKDIETFPKFIDVLVNNVDVSGSFELLNTFINRTTPPDTRYVFCEILSKLNFVQNLIDVMTLSDVEDKQRNACQLLCDIIVIGRQEASEQTDTGPMAQDMLAEKLESSEAIRGILEQMFSKEMKNSTAIVCGMKVLRTLLEQKAPSDLLNNQLATTIEKVQREIETYLVQFHDLLLNPPKQEPIKTTFGIIQKPLGYMRLEVVNLIRALIGTNSSNIIKKLVELKTMKTIIDLFIDYSWNNLLHTQVEQALCLIIKNCRHDEDLNYQIETETKTEAEEQEPQQEIPSRALLSQLLDECDLIGRLLLPNSNERANFGHIIQMINSIAINRDLDTIRDHLNEMKDKRPELYDRWTTFVNVDVASFKEISLYYDAQSSSNNVTDRYGPNGRFAQAHALWPSANRLAATVDLPNKDSRADQQNQKDEDPFLAYLSFTSETVIPTINVDVLPKVRRPKN